MKQNPKAENKVLTIRQRKSPQSNTKREVRKKSQPHGMASVQSDGVPKHKNKNKKELKWQEKATRQKVKNYIETKLPALDS